MTIKILHTADWHLGAPGVPPLYFQDALDKLLKVALDIKVDYVLVVGDIFDQPRPDQKIKDFLLQKILSYDLHWVFTIGNHDYADKAKSYHSLRYLQLLIDEGKLDTVTVLEPGQKRRFKEHNVTFHAVTSLNDICTKKNGFYIPCFHGIVPNMDVRRLDFVPTAVFKSTKQLVQASGADYIALGDIHKRLEISRRCRYSGALFQKTYSDEDGYCIVELGEHIHYYPNILDTPKKHTIELDFEPGVDTEKSIIKFIKTLDDSKGNFCKLVFNLPISVYNSIDQDTVQKGLEGHCLEVKFDNKPVVENRLRKEAAAIKDARSIAEEIDIVIDGYATKLDKDILKKTCNAFIPR